MAELQSLLPSRSTPFEKAFEQAAGKAIARVDPDALRRMRDPYRASVSHLPFLAWGRGVDLWRDAWPEWKKRRITAEIYGMKGLKGTLPGIDKYLSFVDASIYDAVIPPVGVYAVEYSAEAMETWRAQFPELRLYPYSIPGKRPAFPAGSDTRIAPSFVGMCFALPNEAARYYGRRATIVEDGEEREIRSFDQLGTWGSDAAFETTTFAIPGEGTFAETIEGRAWVGHAYVPAANHGRLVVIDTDGTFGSGQVPAGVDSAEALNIAPERVYDPHEARYLEGFASPEGLTGAGWQFAYSDVAAQYIFDRWRLLSAERVKMHTTGLLAPFVGRSYVGLTPYTALLRVKATYQREGWWSFAGHAYVGATHVGTPTDRIKDVGEAIYRSRSLRDQIWFTTATYRPMGIQDLSFEQAQPWSGMVPIERATL